jgi:hypothetical protein
VTLRCTDIVDDHDSTQDAIDEEFARTQHIGDAIGALAAAELAVAAAGDLDSATAARLEQIRRTVVADITQSRIADDARGCDPAPDR